MTTGHTPGPWETDTAEHDEPYQPIGIHPVGRKRKIVSVHLDDAPVHDFNIEQRANARLIAAAPELLEALEEILAITDRDHCAWDRARAAIAKATGA